MPAPGGDGDRLVELRARASPGARDAEREQTRDHPGRRERGGAAAVAQLPDVVVAPAARAAIGHQRAGVPKPAGDSNGAGKVHHKPGRRLRHNVIDSELAQEITAPTPCRAIGPECAAMRIPTRDGHGVVQADECGKVAAY